MPHHARRSDKRSKPLNHPTNEPPQKYQSSAKCPCRGLAKPATLYTINHPYHILKRNQPIITMTTIALLCAHRYEQCILQPAVDVLCRNRTFLSDYYDKDCYDVLKSGGVIKRYT